MAAANRQNTDILFRRADEAWRAEMIQRHGETAVARLRYTPEARGEPGSRLRQAYNARERAYQLWIRARGLGDFRHAPRSLAAVPEPLPGTLNA
ncbi:hypothetical protein U8607_21365 [Methylobacterium durans]|uniref:hypothetical protein n=1 Tax=Methylobacterium durans TaxID=2202825 RepID=UPI002AFDCDD3|nr:hypothetical protein [Methylobacterium durans]MEA1834646.1 hypothetical protein [Methylobacterium durans]